MWKFNKGDRVKVTKEIFTKESKFQIGDVVEDIQDVSQSLSNPLYVIKEPITLVDNDLPVGYSYEVAPINSPDGSDIFRAVRTE